MPIGSLCIRAWRRNRRWRLYVVDNYIIKIYKDSTQLGLINMKVAGQEKDIWGDVKVEIQVLQ